jgi:multidrug efflux pump subunit AcrA (membrane-fusion protein)
LESTVIRAPVDGVVLTGDLDRRTGDHVQVGEALLELAEDDAWMARVLIDQTDRPKVHPGQRVRVFVHAYPHLEFGVLEGSVARITAQAASNGTGYPVDVDLERADFDLADGIGAEVRVAVDSGRLLQLVWHRLLHGLGRTTIPDLREARS